MRTLLFTALLFVISLSFAQGDTLGVEWQNDYHLKCSDFRGEEDKSRNLSAL